MVSRDDMCLRRCSGTSRLRTNGCGRLPSLARMREVCPVNGAAPACQRLADALNCAAGKTSSSPHAVTCIAVGITVEEVMRHVCLGLPAGRAALARTLKPLMWRNSKRDVEGEGERLPPVTVRVRGSSHDQDDPLSAFHSGVPTHGTAPTWPL